MRQCQEFEMFTGTTQWYQIPNSKYVYTDGIKWLLKQIYPNNLEKQKWFLNTCTYYNDFHNPFNTIKLIFDKKDNQKRIEITDGDNHVITKIVPDFELDDGEYRIFVYNFCIMAASEY